MVRVAALEVVVRIADLDVVVRIASLDVLLSAVPPAVLAAWDFM